MNSRVSTTIRARLTKFLLGPSTIALIAMLCIGWLGWLRPIDHRLQDIVAALSRHTENSDLVLIEIDTNSLQQLHTWPWPRRYHAQLLEKLRKADVNTVFYDVDFSSKSSPEDDDLLEQALSGYARKDILLPGFIQPKHSLNKDNLIVTIPLRQFYSHSTPTSVNIQPDGDGLVRRIAGSWRLGDTVMELAAIRMSGRREFLDQNNRIDFSIDPHSFTRYSFVDVLDGRVGIAQLRGKNIIVGATAIELGDILPVPVYRSLPGAVVQALSYQTMKNGGIHEPAGPVTFFMVVALTIFLNMTLKRHSWRGALLITAASLIIVFGVAVYLYREWHVLDHIAQILGLLILSYAFSLIARLEQQQLRLLIQGLALRRKDKLMAAVVNTSIDAIVTVSKRGDITSVNPAAQTMFCTGANNLVGQPIGFWIGDLSSSNSYSDVLMPLATEEGKTFEFSARRFDNSRFPVEATISRMEIENEILYTVIIRDTTERMEQRNLLVYQATHDALTGLNNRYYLIQELGSLIEKAAIEKKGISLLLIDLDKFKEVNDSLGHATGDKMLKQISRRFTDCIDNNFILARIGGDEFAVIVNVCNDVDITHAERLLKSLLMPFPVNDVSLEIGASIGIARYPDDGDNPDQLLQNADTAMYVAKRTRSGVERYQQQFSRKNALRFLISTGLREAIVQDSLSIQYQAKQDINSGTIIGVEALLRWKHPLEGYINPEDIVEVAEATGMIWDLTEWVLKSAGMHAREWQKKGYNICIAVNLSARLLQDANLPEKINHCITVESQWITLEITESAIMVDPEAAMKNAVALKDIGIALSIDDFGTGYSSLSYLKMLPASELKIDKSFVMDMINNPNDALIVNSTIELAHNLGLKVVAEGVESREILTTLINLRCDVAQGYYINRPVPFEEMTELLAKNNGHNIEMIDVNTRRAIAK